MGTLKVRSRVLRASLVLPKRLWYAPSACEPSGPLSESEHLTGHLTWLTPWASQDPLSVFCCAS